MVVSLEQGIWQSFSIPNCDIVSLEIQGINSEDIENYKLILSFGLSVVMEFTNGNGLDVSGENIAWTINATLLNSKKYRYELYDFANNKRVLHGELLVTPSTGVIHSYKSVDFIEFLKGEKGDSIINIEFVENDLVFTLSGGEVIVLSNAKLELKGEQGEGGIDGINGNGIVSIILLASNGLVDTYRITFDNLTTFDFDVKNGEDAILPEFKTINNSTIIGSGNILLSEQGHTHTASEVTDFDVEVANNVEVIANTTSRHTHTNLPALENVSGVNTGDETTLSVQTKRPLKAVEGNSLEGSGDISLTTHKTTNTISFESNAIHGTKAGPITADLVLSLTNARIGMVVTAWCNLATIPTFVDYWLNGSDTDFVASELCLITFHLHSGNYIVATLNK